MTTMSSRPIVPRTLTRAEAARLVRSARRAMKEGSERAGELVGWAFSALRDSIPVRKLKIDYWLSVAHHDSADALIARTIMQGHDEPLLRLRFARSLHAQGRMEQAEAEIQKVLTARPSNVAAMALAARVASDTGNHAEAVTLLILANELQQRDPAIEQTMVQALLDARLTNHAAECLARMKFPPAILTARALWAQGRMLEAMDCLEWSVSRLVPGEAIPSDLAGDLLQLAKYMDESLDAPRLQRLKPILAVAPLEVQLQAVQTLLLLGETSSISEWMTPADSERPAPAGIASVSMIAQAVAGATSNQAIRELEDEVEPALPETDADTRETASLWLRGLMGMLCTAQCDARQAGADPSSAMLPALLREAIGVFAGHLESKRLSAVAKATLEHHRTVCLQVLGWSQDTPASTVELQAAGSAMLRRAA